MNMKFFIFLGLILPSLLQAKYCAEAVVDAVKEAKALQVTLKDGTKVDVEFPGFSLANVEDSATKAALLAQLREIEIFLSELGADHPDRKCPICSVYVRPGTYGDHFWNRQLVWHGGESITVKFPISGSGPMPADGDVMRRNWNTGKHHSTKTLRLGWAFLNPAGPLRLALRRAMTRVMQSKREKFAGIAARLDGAPGGLAHEIRRAILDTIGKADALSDGARDVFSRLDDMPVPEQKRLLAELDQRLGSVDAVDQVETGLANAISSQSQQPRASWSVAISLFVSVSNAHDISVRISVVNGELRSESVKRGPLRTFSFALLVAVATSDRVIVDMGHEKAAPTLAIETALRDFRVEGGGAE